MVHFRSDWLDNIQSMQREMVQLLDQFAGRKPPMVRFAPSAWEPPIDMYETADSVVVVAELAGVKQEEVRISVHAKTLIIRGVRRGSQARSRRTYYQMEISTGPFERGVLLPVAVDAGKATASYNDGILQIVLPKVSQERPRRIDIRTA
jgi:HSP20 family protein